MVLNCCGLEPVIVIRRHRKPWCLTVTAVFARILSSYDSKF